MHEAALSANYDMVIVDLGAGVERSVLQLADSAASCIVISTEEPTSLTDAYAYIKVTHMERPGTDVQIVVNMANSTREGERTYATLHKACEGFLKISPPLLGVIRRDRRVREAIRSQVSALTRSPNAEAIADVEAIAKKLFKAIEK